MEYKQLVAYFEQEIKAEDIATRKCLERVPPSVYGFKPHEKSMEMGYLTLLTADIPKWISLMILESTIDLATYERFSLSTTEALLKRYDENVKGALDALKNITDAQANAEFSLKMNGQLLYSTPMLRSIGETINHWVHHRGQLTVYMRLNDISVPSIYGPSADDNQFKKS